MFDVAIIGAGIIGCSILNKLTRLNKSCIVLEKGLDVSVGTTKANSGLIHAGFDCAKDSLKAKLNIKGSKLFPKLCKELGVKYKQTGALVIGNDLQAVKDLYERGIYNGLTSDELEILNKEQLLKILPNINEQITCGLHAKTAAIFSPYLYTIALAEQAVLNGATIKFDFNVNKVIDNHNFYTICSDKNQNIQAKIIINATSFNFNYVSALIGAETYPTEYKRGEYFLLDTSVKDLTPLTVFPLPTKDGKGILITPTIDGNYLVGPTSYSSDYDTKTTLEGLNIIREHANNLIKDVPLNKIIRVFSGVRTNVADDFIIQKSKLKNNVINLAGINSPGLSCAPAIADYVAQLLNFTGEEKQLQKRTPYTVTKELSQNKLNQLILKDSNYGKTVCRCENVTMGEILEAINSPLKPKTVDGIKRRVRAGMGRCQGGFCFLKVIEAIAKQNNIKLDDVNKESNDSTFIISDIKQSEVKK